MNHAEHSDSLNIPIADYSHAWTPLFAPRAVGHVKALRGGAQSHLLRCDDRNLYVVKFRNNPQGHRILINEWIATAVARYVGLTTPDVAPVWLDADFLSATPDLALRLGNRSIPIESGYHFASRYVGDTNREPYEFLPDTLLPKVANLDHFIGALIVDKFLGNADARQCVFVCHAGAFHAHMIDFGYAFNGPNWDLNEADLSGLYFRPAVYDNLTCPAALEPWMTRVEDMPFSVFASAVETLPAEWLAPADRETLDRLLRKIHRRRHSLRTSLEALFARRHPHFSAWRHDA